jgi:hypothetical protein
MPESSKEKLTSFLYYLGKGLWKSVPILGSIVEEVLYNQFENELRSRVNHLDENKVNEILEQIQNINIEEFYKGLSKVSEDIKIENLNLITNFLKNIEDSFNEFYGFLTELERKIIAMPDIKKILDDIEQKAGNKEAILMALNELQLKREIWINRLSSNQKKLLLNIPKDPTDLNSLWSIVRIILPDCGYKEFRFRLHELEWLGLVERYWSNSGNSWIYQKK